MFEERYRSMMERIQPEDDLLERTLDAAENPQRRTSRKLPALRLAAGAVCALVLLVIVAARILPPPRDIVASNGKTNLENGDSPPLNSLPSDEITLTVSDVTSLNEHEIAFTLNVRGDRVDPLTTINYSPELFFFDKCQLSVIETPVTRAPNECCFRFTLGYDAGPILEQLDNHIDAAILNYTSGNQLREYSLNLDWDALDYTVPRNSEPLYPLDNFFAVTGIWLTEDDELVMQLRWPIGSGSYRFLIPSLYNASTEKHLYAYDGYQFFDDEYIYFYHNYTFSTHRNELHGLTLAFEGLYPGEVIEGNWPFTVDLTHLTAE